MTNETNPPTKPEEVIIWPTILYRPGRGPSELRPLRAPLRTKNSTFAIPLADAD